MAEESWQLAQDFVVDKCATSHNSDYKLSSYRTVKVQTTFPMPFPRTFTSLLFLVTEHDCTTSWCFQRNFIHWHQFRSRFDLHSKMCQAKNMKNNLLFREKLSWMPNVNAKKDGRVSWTKFFFLFRIKNYTQTACIEIRDMCKRRLRAGENYSCELRYFNLFSICFCQ